MCFSYSSRNTLYSVLETFRKSITWKFMSTFLQVIGAVTLKKNHLSGCAGSWLQHGLSRSCGEWGLLSRYGAQASHCGSFSCCGARTVGCVALIIEALGLGSTASVVVAHRLSCSKACGIFPDLGRNSCLLRWQADSLPLSHQGNFCFQFIDTEKNLTVIKGTMLCCLMNSVNWDCFLFGIQLGISKNEGFQPDLCHSF